MPATSLSEPFRTGSRRLRAVLKRIRRDPATGAFEDILAALSGAAGVREVTSARIRSITMTWRVDLERDLRGRTIRFYRDFLRHCLEDHKLSNDELEDLAHLRRILRLDPHDVDLAHRRIAREVYSRSVDDLLTDATIDPGERAFLGTLREQLGISRSVADNIEAVRRLQRDARDRVPPKRMDLP